MGLGEWIDVKAIGTGIVAFLPRLLLAGLILILSWVTYRVTRPPLREILRRGHLDNALIHLLVDNIYRLALIVMAVVIAAGQIGINILPALAGLGIAGIALGFAAQDSVANVISGFLIFWDKPFVVGDHVSVQDQYGRVDEITLRTTRVRTPSNGYVVIPNRKVIESTLINYSKHGGTRVDVPVGIASDESLEKVRLALLPAVAAVEGVVLEPAPDLVVTALKAGSIDLLVRVWVDDAAFERPVFFRVTEACLDALDRAGIRTPSPHIQLLLENDPASAGSQTPLPLRPPNRPRTDEE